MASTQFTNVKVTVTPDGGTATSTQCLLDLSGLGSEREVNELTCLNDEVILGVGPKKYDTMTFKVPYDETAAGFHEVVQTAYDANTLCAVEVEFDNMPTAGVNGTKLTGSARMTAAKLDNDSKVLTNTFSLKWEGAPTRTKAA